jgi:hypothetical protein
MASVAFTIISWLGETSSDPPASKNSCLARRRSHQHHCGIGLTRLASCPRLRIVDRSHCLLLQLGSSTRFRTYAYHNSVSSSATERKTATRQSDRAAVALAGRDSPRRLLLCNAVAFTEPPSGRAHGKFLESGLLFPWAVQGEAPVGFFRPPPRGA